MAAFVLTDCKVIIGVAWTGTAPGSGNPTVSGTVTTDLALNDHIRSVTLNNTAAMEDFTTFSDGGFTVVKPGLFSADIQIDFNQDYAASNVDATFGAAILAGTTYYIDVKPTSSARGATNASWVYKTFVTNYQPIANAVGERTGTVVSFAVDGKPARLTA